MDLVAASNAGDGTAKIWHTLTSEAVLIAVRSRHNGLSPAEVLERRSADGPNILHTVQRTPWPRILLRQFKSLLIWVLVAAAILSAVLGEWIDCFAVLTIIGLNAVIGFYQESNLWFTIKQPDYMLHTTNYQRSVEALYTAATDKNLDAATEAYAKFAQNCVECHRVVRLEQHRQAVLKGK